MLVDAGHGGEDGGAAFNGVVEKDINLDIALKTGAMLELFFVRVDYTRMEDVSLHAADASTIRARKASDLRARVALVEELGNPVFISIHQNTYPSARETGTQVFFSPNNPLSETLAKHIRDSVLENLDPANRRKIRKATDDIFVLSQIGSPAVIIECGFLTNSGEAKRLCDGDYQRKVAATIAAGTLMFLAEETT